MDYSLKWNIAGMAEEPHDFIQSLKEHFGSTDRLKNALTDLDEMRVDRARRKWLFGSIRVTALWAAGVATAFIATKDFLLAFFRGIK